MQLIKVKFIQNGEPKGRAYTYDSKGDYKVGDLVQINERGHGVVTEINVPESEVESFKDKIKCIVGKIEENGEVNN